MILNDRQIHELCQGGWGNRPMISPFVPVQEGKPSYGLGSFGYDIRLGNKFLVPQNSYVKKTGSISMAANDTGIPQEIWIVDQERILSPLDKERNEKNFLEQIREDRFILFPNQFVLGESLEWFDMPADVMCISFGKSTYARLGVVPHVTPLEPQWRGRLTMEIANTGPLPVELIVGQGIAQLVFFRGERPMRTYAEKESGGVYQNQTGVWLPQ